MRSWRRAVQRKFAFLLFVLGLALMTNQACAPRLAPESDCHFVQNSLDQRVSWENQVPVTLAIHSSVPAQYHESMRLAADWWNTRAGRSLLNIAPGLVSGPLAPRQDGASVIYYLNTWETDSSTFEQARTSIYWRGDRIVEADVRINGFRFGSMFSVAEPVPFGRISLPSLMIHEFGHVLGLAHIEIEQSVMKKYLLQGESRIASAGTIEMQALSCEYL
jgi:hypothetical protein